MKVDREHEQLIREAEAKYEHEQLVAEAEKKWNQENFKPSADPSMKTVDIKDRGMAGLESFGNMATMGYLPQIQAGVEKMLPDPNRKLKTEMEAQGFKSDEKPRTYVMMRDANIERMKRAEEKYPKTTMAAGLAGGIMSGPLIAGALPSLGAAKGVGLLSRLGRGAAGGAVQGAAMNPGDIEGEINPVQLEARAHGGLIGAGIGAAGQAVGEVAGKGISKLQAAPEELKESAYQRAFKALGPYQKDVLRNQDKMTGIGKTLIDKKIVGAMPKSYQKLSEQANTALTETGEKFDQYLNKIADAAEGYMQGKNMPSVPGSKVPSMQAGVNKKSIAESLREEMHDQSGLPGASSRNQYYENLVKEFESGDPFLSIRGAQKMKEAAGKQINWKRIPGSDVPDSEKFYRSLYGKLRQGVEDAAEGMADVLGKDAKKDFIKIKQEYGALKEASKIANERSGREFANRYLSMSDYQAGQGAAAVGALAAIARGGSASRIIIDAALGKLIGAVANKGARRYGNQLAAHTALKTAKVLESRPELMKQFESQLKDLVQKDPEALAAGLVRISKHPEFIKSSEGEAQ